MEPVRGQLDRHPGGRDRKGHAGGAVREVRALLSGVAQDEVQDHYAHTGDHAHTDAVHAARVPVDAGQLSTGQRQGCVRDVLRVRLHLGFWLGNVSRSGTNGSGCTTRRLSLSWPMVIGIFFFFLSILFIWLLIHIFVSLNVKNVEYCAQPKMY